MHAFPYGSIIMLRIERGTGEFSNLSVDNLWAEAA